MDVHGAPVPHARPSVAQMTLQERFHPAWRDLSPNVTHLPTQSHDSFVDPGPRHGRIGFLVI
jgi:hypothetical protein